MVSSLQRVFAAHEELGKDAIRKGLRRVRGKLRDRASVVFSEVIESLAREGKKSLYARIVRPTSGNVAGIAVSVTTKEIHTNRYGQKKPAAYWLEYGTDNRVTRGDKMPHPDAFTGRVRLYGRRKTAHSTGNIDPPALAMEKAESRIDEHVIDNDVIIEIQKACDNIIEKYGL